MNALNRAWKYITRKPTKSVLLMITFFLIGNLVILGLGISQAAGNAKILTRKQMRAAVSYEVDYDKFWDYINTLTDEDEINEAYNNYPRINKETAEALTEDSRVKAFNFVQNSIGYSVGFDHVPVGNEDSRNVEYGSYIDENGVTHEYREPDMMIYGTQFPEMIEIADETYTIVSGRFINQDDIDSAAPHVCITEELAEVNNFRVGDTISFSYNDLNYIESIVAESNGELTADDFYEEYEIIGIYNNKNQVDPNSENFRWMSAYESPQNILIVPMSSYVESMLNMVNIERTLHPEYYEDFDEEEYRRGMTEPSRIIYLLNDPLEVDDFVRDHQSDLGDYLKLNANNDTFKKLARPLDTLSFFSNVIVWIVVINAIVIISLVTALTLKTREYEIGVMLSLGVSKVKIVLQLFAELFLIALLSFTLASVSGSMLAGKVGDMVLDYQTASEAEYSDLDNDNNYYWYGDNNYFTDITQEDLLSQYEVKVSPVLIGEIYVIGTLVVMISIIIPSFMIMRLNPKQILLEQN